MSETLLRVATVADLRWAIKDVAPDVPVAWRMAEEVERPAIIDALGYPDGAGLEILISFTERPSNAHFISIGPAPDGGLA